MVLLTRVGSEPKPQPLMVMVPEVTVLIPVIESIWRPVQEVLGAAVLGELRVVE
jgi:hypothetical protein